MQAQIFNNLKHTHSFGLENAKKAEKYTLIVITMTALTMAVEVTTGILFGSIALIADGAHMGSHTLALGIAAFAYYYTRKNTNDRRFSFGTGKVNALGLDMDGPYNGNTRGDIGFTMGMGIVEGDKRGFA